MNYSPFKFILEIHADKKDKCHRYGFDLFLPLITQNIDKMYLAI